MPSATPAKLPPGPSPESWTASFKTYSRDPLSYMPNLVKEYGDIVTMRYYNFRVYFVSHPDYIEQVLVNDNRKYIKGRILRKNKQLFGNGLLTSEGDFWLRQRRLAQPAFHRARIATYADTMVRYASRLAAEWSNGDERDIHAEMMRLTLAIVAKTLFDADVDHEAKRVGHALEAIMHFNSDFRKLILTPTWLPTPRKIRATFATAKLNRIIYRFIEERRQSANDNGDLLSMLLAARDDDGSRMTDRQLRDEAITIFLAGHETTANALSWTWMLLAQNPTVEAKLHAELDSVLRGHAPSLDDVPNLPYTGHVITESMRLFPPAWGMARIAIEDTEIAGYPIPKGCGVSLAQWVVHRDPRWFDAPMEFRPERWEGDLLKRLPRFAYFPFGGGPRQCIGNNFAVMEAVLLLATIAQKFRIQLVPGKAIVPAASITLRPKTGIWGKIEAR
ncbi:MAG: cytochrome P450 [Candidatus Acidiferrum sp.]|jgi:cytochrome P450